MSSSKCYALVLPLHNGKKKMESNQLVVSFVETIKNDGINLVSGLAEVGLDVFISNEIIKNIPILSTVWNGYQLCAGIYNFFTMKKLYRFISNIKESSQEERQKYIEYATEKPKEFSKLFEYTLIIISKLLQEEKTDILNSLFISFVNSEIDLLEYMRYVEVLDRLFPGDIFILLSGNISIDDEKDIDPAYLRLLSLVLMVEHKEYNFFETEYTNMEKEISIEQKYGHRSCSLTVFGNKLLFILTKAQKIIY